MLQHMMHQFSMHLHRNILLVQNCFRQSSSFLCLSALENFQANLIAFY
jgi:hypothetical protein